MTYGRCTFHSVFLLDVLEHLQQSPFYSFNVVPHKRLINSFNKPNECLFRPLLNPCMHYGSSPTWKPLACRREQTVFSDLPVCIGPNFPHQVVPFLNKLSFLLFHLTFIFHIGDPFILFKHDDFFDDRIVDLWCMDGMLPQGRHHLTHLYHIHSITLKLSTIIHGTVMFWPCLRAPIPYGKG